MSARPITATTRRCKVCGVVKPIEEFTRSSGKRRTSMRSCHDCFRTQRRRDYAADPRTMRRTIIHQERTRRMNRERVWAYLRSHPCVDCGESDPLVIDFDHVRGEKLEGLATLVRRKSWAKVEAEMAKCEVRCSNCHRRRTAVQLGYHRFMGRDHDAEARAALDEVAGRQNLFPAPGPELPLPGFLVTNLAECMNECMALDPQSFKVGEMVTAYVLISGDELDGVARAESAVLIRSENLTP